MCQSSNSPGCSVSVGGTGTSAGFRARLDEPASVDVSSAAAERAGSEGSVFDSDGSEAPDSEDRNSFARSRTAVP